MKMEYVEQGKTGERQKELKRGRTQRDFELEAVFMSILQRLQPREIWRER